MRRKNLPMHTRRRLALKCGLIGEGVRVQYRPDGSVWSINTCAGVNVGEWRNVSGVAPSEADLAALMALAARLTGQAQL